MAIKRIQIIILLLLLGVIIVFSIKILKVTTNKNNYIPSFTNTNILEIESDNEEDVHITSRTDTDNILETEYNPPFFGLWMLDNIALRVFHQGELGMPKRYSWPEAEDFVGYELEITRDFVRLGERKLFYPDFRYYYISEKRWLFSSNEHVWKPAYFDSPVDFFEYMNENGVEIGLVPEGSSNRYIIRVRTRYELDPEIRAPGSGEIFDPETLDTSRWQLLNTIFTDFMMVSKNYMLVGRSDLVLARRLE